MAPHRHHPPADGRAPAAHPPAEQRDARPLPAGTGRDAGTALRQPGGGRLRPPLRRAADGVDPPS
jgi:hypothetical protein